MTDLIDLLVNLCYYSASDLSNFRSSRDLYAHYARTGQAKWPGRRRRLPTQLLPIAIGEDRVTLAQPSGAGAWDRYGNPIFISYTKSCLAYGGQSLVFLPWRQLWTYKLVVLTLPYAPFYLISFTRFAVWWMHLRYCPTYNTRPVVPGMNGRDLAEERRKAAIKRMWQVREVLVGDGK